jgi:predicted nucleic acid-binding protein
MVAVLVGSSLWVHQLRKGGDPAKRERRLELRRGVITDAERKTLRPYEASLPDYAISPAVWDRAVRLADRGRAAGVTVPLADLLIFACAKEHGLDLAHDDAHFEELATLET